MKLDSPILIFLVVMIGLIIAIVLSFVLPAEKAIAVSSIILGSWFMILGLTGEAKPYELLATTPQVYVVFGGLMITVSATYLVHIDLQNTGLTLLVFTIGVTMIITLSYIVGARKSR